MDPKTRDRDEWVTRADTYFAQAEEFARTAQWRWDHDEEYVAEAAQISQAFSQLAQTMMLRDAVAYGWGD